MAGIGLTGKPKLESQHHLGDYLAESDCSPRIVADGRQFCAPFSRVCCAVMEVHEQFLLILW